MVPKLGTTQTEPPMSRGEKQDDSYRCLLEDAHLKQINRPAETSFFGRLAKSFGFVKSVFQRFYSSKSSRVENEEKVKSFQKSNSSLDKQYQVDTSPGEKHENQMKIKGQAANKGLSEHNNECSSSELTSYGTFLSCSDLEPIDNLIIEIRDMVSTSPYCSKIAISELVAHKISQDIIETAEEEPCGLKGCKVIVSLDDRGDSIHLGEFNSKEGFICTFEVHVILKIKRKRLRSFIPFLACMPQTLHVSEQYNISKRKLYTCNNSRAGTPVHW